MIAYERLSVQPLAGALGAEIGGVDLARLDDAGFAELRRAFREHLVLFFRDQRLDAAALKSFTRRFGPLFRTPYVEPLEGEPDIVAVRKEAEERNISVFGGAWHSDFSFLEAPPLGSVLYALEVPPQGGDTLFANMHLAYETLSPGMRRLLDRVEAMHSGHVYGAARPASATLRTSASMAISRGDPEADRERAHPAVLVHPDTGRRALFVNPIYTTRLADMNPAECRGMLEFLYAHATQPRFTCRFRWRPGSVALWDNRATLHLAIDDYDGFGRLLWRTAIAGEKPLGPSSDPRRPAS
jgi:taurine dioxygenase